MPTNNTPYIIDGSLDFSGGVDSNRTTTIQSARNPDGLRRNQLAWMNNCTVRGGGITQRTGWANLGQVLSSGLYQGGIIYEPPFATNYLLLSISGHIYKVDVTTFSVTDLSVQFGVYNNPNELQAFFVQAEEFVVIQSGDNTTLPLFWDGVTLRRSNGLTGNITDSATGVPVSYVVHVTASFTPIIGTPVAVYMSDPSASHLNNKIDVTDSLGAPVGYFGVAHTSAAGEAWQMVSGVPALWPAGEYFCTLVSPANYTANLTASFVVPPVGGKVTMIHSSGGYLGNVGDTAVIQNQFAVNIGTFLVTAFTAGQIEIQTISSPLIGETIPATYDMVMTLTSPTTAGSSLGINELPAGTAMDYYMGRIWYAQGRSYSAGDIVGGASGTPEYQQRDSVLKVTENPLIIGGDGFAVPSNSGNIRGLQHSATIDTTMGEGQLYIFTTKSIYSLTVPVTRNEWIDVSANNLPLQKLIQRTNGSVNDRGIVAVNGDLYYQALEPSIRSLIAAQRFYGMPGNTPISIEETRILQFNDRELLRYCSGCEFNNRLLMTALPRMTPNGVAHQALIPLNFDVQSSMAEKKPPVWEGMYEGVDFMQVMSADFGGRQRGFAIMASRDDHSLQVWELTDNLRFENGDNRVTWQVETPAYTFGDEFAKKRLVTADLWIDKLYGEVIFNVEFRADGDPCWHPWHKWKQCVARNCEEDVNNPVCYPVEPFRESFRAMMTLPKPSDDCNPISKRPLNVGYQFQLRITITGWCRIRGLLLRAEPVESSMFEDIIC